MDEFERAAAEMWDMLVRIKTSENRILALVRHRGVASHRPRPFVIDQPPINICKHEHEHIVRRWLDTISGVKYYIAGRDLVEKHLTAQISTEAREWNTRATSR